MAYKAITRNVQDVTTALSVHVLFVNLSSNQVTDVLDISLAYGTDITAYTLNEIVTAAQAQIISYSTSQGYGITANDIVWEAVNTLSPSELNAIKAAVQASTSYQTIVSQTGTSAPAVSGGMTPVNSYSGTTFTWARTGAGIYTLTASQAVFNTSGKTGVFISPLNNLNASVRGVVTSSTVITITTAVQSVAVLGLLGLTTTNTDALLVNSMIYVQTYP